MSTQYELQRAEIKSQLEAVSGIGKVIPAMKNPTNEADFKAAYVSGGVVNVAMFTRGTDSGTLEDDETSTHLFSDRSATWRIVLLYGFHDDPTTPSEYTFQKLCEAIEDKFRFLQDLNGKAFNSQPLNRITSGLFQFLGGTVLCHKAEWNLQIDDRIEDGNVYSL